MNTTSTQTDEIDLTGVTLTITLSEYEKLREMKKTNETLLEELENMTKAYNRVREKYDNAHSILERLSKFFNNVLFYQDHEWCVQQPVI